MVALRNYGKKGVAPCTLALTEPAFEKYFGNTKTLSALLVLRTNFIEHQRHLCNMPHCIGLLYPLKALLYCTIIAAMLHNFCSRRRWMRWRRWMRRTRWGKRLSVTGSTVIHHSLTVHKTDYDAVQYTLCNNHTLTNTCSAFSQSRRFLNAHTHTALSWVSRRSYYVLYSVHCTVTSM